MVAINPPSWLQNVATHTAQGERLTLGGLVGKSGIASSADLLVSQRAAGANMSVDVGGGTAFIKGTQNTYQGVYSITNDAVVNLSVTAAHATLARKDIVIARVYDAFYAGATNTWALEVIAGTAAASPVEPSLPADSLKLATLSIGANATTVTTANITRADIVATSRLVSTPDICTSTTRPTQGLVDGYTIYETDSNVLAVYEGGAWKDIGPRSTGLVTSGLVTAVTGFTVVNHAGILTGRVGQMTITMQRTGATIAASATGDIANVGCCNIVAGWRPLMNTGWTTGASGPVVGGFTTAAGVAAIASLMPNVNLASGAQFSFSYTFVQGN